MIKNIFRRSPKTPLVHIWRGQARMPWTSAKNTLAVNVSDPDEALRIARRILGKRRAVYSYSVNGVRHYKRSPRLFERYNPWVW